MQSQSKDWLNHTAARIAYQTYFCLLGTILMILSIISICLYEEAFGRQSYIIENWKQQPISSIRVSFEKCGPQEEDLIYYDWPGTQDGCDCRGYSGILRMLYSTKTHDFYPKRKIYTNHLCNFTQLSYGCANIYAQAERVFNFFPDPTGLQGYSLCASREIGNAFYDFAPQSNQCLPGQKSCGTDPNYFYCTSAAQCPITKIGLKGQSELRGAEEVPIRDGAILLVSRSYENSLPLSQTRVSEGTGVCINNHQRAITPGRGEYALMKKNRVDCIKDSRFELIYSVGEEEYYQANSAMDLKQKLPGFQIDQAYKWGFYQRTYIEWKMHCRGEIMHEFKQQQSRLDSIEETQIMILVLNCLFFLFISLILSILQCGTILGVDWCCVPGSGNQESNRIFYFEIGCKVAIQLVDTILIFMSYSSINKEIKLLERILALECSDPQTNAEVQMLQRVLVDNVYEFNVVYLVLFILTTVIDCMVVSYFTVQYYRHKYNPQSLRYKSWSGAAQEYEMMGGINSVQYMQRPPPVEGQGFQQHPQLMPIPQAYLTYWPQQNQSNLGFQPVNQPFQGQIQPNQQIPNNSYQVYQQSPDQHGNAFT